MSCDFCIHAIFEVDEGGDYDVYADGCELYDDDEHKDLVARLGVCDSFHCINA